MLVLILKSCAGLDRTYGKGWQGELDDETAYNFIYSGLAAEVKAETKIEKVEKPIVKKRK